MNPKLNRELEDLCINTIRILSADAVQNANAGHPGMPMGAAVRIMSRLPLFASWEKTTKPIWYTDLKQRWWRRNGWRPRY
jgi:transketolase